MGHPTQFPVRWGAELRMRHPARRQRNEEPHPSLKCGKDGAPYTIPGALGSRAEDVPPGPAAAKRRAPPFPEVREGWGTPHNSWCVGEPSRGCAIRPYQQLVGGGVWVGAGFAEMGDGAADAVFE